MAKMGYVENPARSKRRRRRRNPVTATTKRVQRRNGTTKAGALSYAKKNGLVLRKAGTPARAAANPKRKRRHHKLRNGIAARSSRNGIFGNTKHDALQVGSLLAGMGVTKIGGRIVSGFLGSLAASVGMGDYAEIAGDLAIALFVAPMIGGFIDKAGGKQNARLGGLAVVGLELINKFAPSAFSSLNPFSSSSPVVLAGGQPAVTPAAVAQIVANSGAPPENVAKVAGAMRALANGTRVQSNMSGGRIPMPLYN